MKRIPNLVKVSIIKETNDKTPTQSKPTSLLPQNVDNFPMTDYDYRSKSTAFDRRDMQQIQPYTGPPVRSYSTSTSSYNQSKDFNLEMTKGTSGSSSTKNWGFNDPEFQRRRRVAGYKVYTAEGRVKGSFKHSFRWFKDKYTKVVYGWW